MYWFLNILTSSQRLPSENSSHVLSSHYPPQKVAAFCNYIYHALSVCSDLSYHGNDLNYLKFFIVSQGSPSIIKALNKFKKLKHFDC